jgi:hypothetical protein
MAAMPPPAAPPADSPPPKPALPGIEPVEGRAQLRPDQPRSECAEAYACFVEEAMLIISYHHHPQEAYNELIDVFGVSEDATVQVNRIQAADRLQPDPPTVDEMLDDLGMFAPCRQCHCPVNKDRLSEDARPLNPVYYRPLGAVFCCPEHQDAYLKRWQKSLH